MAEVFGIVAGAVGISAAFSACVDCFDLVQAGRHLERDFATESLKLECARYRLGSWGDAVDVYGTSPDAAIHREPSLRSLVEKVLFQILTLFQDSQKASKIYDQARSSIAGNASAASPANSPREGLCQLTASLRNLTLRRRKEGPSLVKRATWAIYHQDELKKLIEGITGLLDELERLVSAPARRHELVTSDASELSRVVTIDSLATLGQAAVYVDNQLVEALQSQVGHVYLGVTANENSRVINGDMVSEGYGGRQLVRSNIYRNIAASGRARVVNGTVYGFGNFLDD
jgi:hypothetical protein